MDAASVSAPNVAAAPVDSAHLLLIPWLLWVKKFLFYNHNFIYF
jgi:hypothetical protein